MIYKFTEVLNDLINYFFLGDILLLKEWKENNNLSDNLGAEFTSNESGDRVFYEGILIPMMDIENYPYTILFNLSNDVPELCKQENKLQFRKSGYYLKVENNMLTLFTWRILEKFTCDNIESLMTNYKQYNKPIIELPNGWYHIEVLGGEILEEGCYEPTFEFIIQKVEKQSIVKPDMNLSFKIVSSTY